MKKENKEKKQIPFITVIVIALIIIAVIVAIVVATSIKAYYNNMHYQGEVLATNYSMQYSNAINDYVDKKLDYLEGVDEDIKECGNISLIFKREEKDLSSKIFYMTQENEMNSTWDDTGNVKKTSSVTEVSDYFKSEKSGITGFFDSNTTVAICYSVKDNPLYKMLVLYIDHYEFIMELMKSFNRFSDMPDFYIMPISNNDGEVIGQLVINDAKVDDDWALDKKISSHDISNIYSSLIFFSSGKINKEDIQGDMKLNGNYSLYSSVYSKEYVLSLFSPIKSFDNLLFCQIYEAEVLLSGQNNFIAIILVSIGILAVIVISLIILGIRYRKAWIQKLEFQENYEPLTGANTYKMFKEKFELITSYNKYSKYAVIYLELKQFDILYENYGDNTTNEVIAFCSKIINKTIDKTETYGHISNGKFIISIHYKNLDDLEHRLSVIYALINNYNKFEKVEFTLSFSAGIYLLNRGERSNADICLNNAIIAEKSVNLTREKYYCIYDEKLDEARQREREIELRKEQAINNKEFQVYFQPKLNLSLDTVDGAEALVRWYYPEQDKIYSPAMFLPIFELNGFVEKLDRYVYLEVLAFMKKMVDSGRKVCPISVNVSRFTALQPDFVSFYTENKKKYGIADNYICIEFTESFAFDNNQKLFEIVKELKKNGLLCSIDDFGVGYSSYSILKDLPMDEIKLDAFFMRHGYDATRDEKTLKSIIKLGKDLGLKVTQEGVESNEQLKKLKEYGCDVLQGYIYSKPLSQNLFEEFLLNKLGAFGKKK